MSIEVIYIIITLSCQLEILGNVIQHTKAQAEQTVILKMGLEANTISMHIYVHIAIILKKIRYILLPMTFSYVSDCFDKEFKRGIIGH